MPANASCGATFEIGKGLPSPAGSACSITGSGKARHCVRRWATGIRYPGLHRTSAKRTPQSESSPGRVDKHNGQIETASDTLNPEAKIRLYRTRFAGRADLFARRWEGRDCRKKGYADVCTNEWRDGIRKKPNVRCHECKHRNFEPVNDAVMREHLTVAQVVAFAVISRICSCQSR